MNGTKQKANKSAKALSIIAMLTALVILIAFAVIPPLVAKSALNDIVFQTEAALSAVHDKDSLWQAINSLDKILDKNSGVLHFLYSHKDVTELELSTAIAKTSTERAFDETGEIINALCRIKTQAQVMIELEKLSLGRIL